MDEAARDQDPGVSLAPRQLSKRLSIDAAGVAVHDQCMAVKTITIDLEAYELLARQKRPGQSFSQLIKQRFGRTLTAADLLRRVRAGHLSSEALDVVEAVVRRRRGDLAKAPR